MNTVRAVKCDDYIITRVPLILSFPKEPIIKFSNDLVVEFVKGCCSCSEFLLMESDEVLSIVAAVMV